MAKRYARLNWQNSPSAATPINAANLNKMDKGIDDIDNALEAHLNNIVQTTSVNDATKYPSSAVTYSLAQSLNNYQLKNGSDNPTDTDFNNYTQTARYTIGVPGNYTNVPIVEDGVLIVDNCSFYIVQRYICRTNSYERIKRGETEWSQWYALR